MQQANMVVRGKYRVNAGMRIRYLRQLVRVLVVVEFGQRRDVGFLVHARKVLHGQRCWGVFGHVDLGDTLVGKGKEKGREGANKHAIIQYIRCGDESATGSTARPLSEACTNSKAAGGGSVTPEGISSTKPSKSQLGTERSIGTARRKETKGNTQGQTGTTDREGKV